MSAIAEISGQSHSHKAPPEIAPIKLSRRNLIKKAGAVLLLSQIPGELALWQADRLQDKINHMQEDPLYHASPMIEDAVLHRTEELRAEIKRKRTIALTMIPGFVYTVKKITDHKNAHLRRAKATSGDKSSA